MLLAAASVVVDWNNAYSVCVTVFAVILLVRKQDVKFLLNMAKRLFKRKTEGIHSR